MINLNHKIDILRHELEIQKKINKELKEKLITCQDKLKQSNTQVKTEFSSLQKGKNEIL